MTEPVAPEDIEEIVGTVRNPYIHYGRAVSADDTIYILHSTQCLDSGVDLTECPFNVALGHGIWWKDWAGYEDQLVVLTVIAGRLVPIAQEGVADGS